MSKRCPTLSADFNPDEARVHLAASNLPDEIKTLFSSLVEVVLFFSVELESKTASLRRLRRMIFRTSEKLRDLPPEENKNAATQAHPGEDNQVSTEPRATPSPVEPEAKPKPKGHGRRSAHDYKGATEQHIAHPSLHHGDRCPECSRGNVYSLKPTVSIRLYGQAPISAVRTTGDKFRCNTCGGTFAADSASGDDEPKYDVKARAIIPLLKYGTGLPFYRLDRLQESAGVPVPASVQFAMCAEGAVILAPLHDELTRQAAQADVLHLDDTAARILGEVAPSGRPQKERAEDDPLERPDNRSGTFTTSVVARKGDATIALYMTGWKHAGENLTDVLARRNANLTAPIQMSDALSRNMPAGLGTIIANCLAHARREFVDIAQIFPGPCRHVIEQLAIVYQNDAVTRDEKMSPEDRLAYHKSHSDPVMRDLNAWMKQQTGDRLVEPNSTLGKAFAYMFNHWDALTLFLRVAGAPLDNNICERALKMAILNRKNAMFFRTVGGARVADIFMSLIQTAKLAGKNVLHYLTATLSNPEHLAANPDQWMPWNYELTLKALAQPG